MVDFNLSLFFLLTTGLTHPEILINTDKLPSPTSSKVFLLPPRPGLGSALLSGAALLSSFFRRYFCLQGLLSRLRSPDAVFVCRTFPYPPSLFLSILDLVRMAEGDTERELQESLVSLKPLRLTVKSQ